MNPCISSIIGEQGETTTGTPQSNPATGKQPTDRDKDQAFLLRAARQAMERGARLEDKALLRSLAALFLEPGENDLPNPQQPARGTNQTKEVHQPRGISLHSNRASNP
jgi:hypothetical protein